MLILIVVLSKCTFNDLNAIQRFVKAVNVYSIYNMWKEFRTPGTGFRKNILSNKFFLTAIFSNLRIKGIMWVLKGITHSRIFLSFYYKSHC